ncbi:hypothetical protein BH09BAC5_BH09BAC5_22430 [soil metagenome]
MTISGRLPVKWIRIALLNFSMLALLGVFLRYKVSFSLPVIEFKNLLHAHSHFAFAGWISTCLYAMLMAFFLDENQQQKKIYVNLFILSQVTAYGMLISFLLAEYGPFSIAFSTLSILVSYFFAWNLWKDTRKDKKSLSVIALRFALICLVLSSIGPYILAYIKSNHILNGVWYNNAIYWYLHFQYNGWFSFAIFAIALHSLTDTFGLELVKRLKIYLWLMIFACIPAYLLSILWSMPPDWVYIIGGLAAFIQVIAYLGMLSFLIKERNVLKFRIRKEGGWLLLFSFISISIKIALQQMLVFPVLNHFVFGHRPVIIGYLHLVLLGFVSFFLIGIAVRKNYLSMKSRFTSGSLFVFVIGVLLNEFCLLLQGFSDILYEPMKTVPAWLFVAALMMFVGITGFAWSQDWLHWLSKDVVREKKDSENPKLSGRKILADK